MNNQLRDYGNCPNCERKDQRIAELEAALKPFADECVIFNAPARLDSMLLAGGNLTLGDLRRAAAVLKEKP